MSFELISLEKLGDKVKNCVVLKRGPEHIKYLVQYKSVIAEAECYTVCLYRGWNKSVDSISAVRTFINAHTGFHVANKAEIKKLIRKGDIEFFNGISSIQGSGV